MKDLPREIFLSQQIKSASPDQAHHDARPARTNLLKPADKICISWFVDVLFRKANTSVILILTPWTIPDGLLEPSMVTWIHKACNEEISQSQARNHYITYHQPIEDGPQMNSQGTSCRYPAPSAPPAAPIKGSFLQTITRSLLQGLLSSGGPTDL